MLYCWFHFQVKSLSIAYLLNGSEQVYWILDLEDEVHSIWVIWTNDLQKCQGNLFFWSRAEWAIVFGWNLKNLKFFCGGFWGRRSRAPAPIHLPLKLHRGRVSVRRFEPLPPNPLNFQPRWHYTTFYKTWV